MCVIWKDIFCWINIIWARIKSEDFDYSMSEWVNKEGLLVNKGLEVEKKVIIKVFEETE